ncbi:MAG: hypothetical protein AB9842_06370 [Bacteroidales bacterium]
MRRILIFIFIIASFPSVLTAQHYRIEYNFTSESKMLTQLKEIIFRDTLTDVIVKKLDVPSMNPFGNLPYNAHEKASKRAGYKVYDLTGKSLKDLVPEKILKNYPYKDPAKVPATIGQYYVDHKPLPGRVILKFTYAIGNDTARLVEYSDIHIFSSDGTELFALVNHDLNILNADLDSNGRYFFFTYGLRSGFKFVLEGGIKIYDLVEYKQVMEFPGNEITCRFIDKHRLYFFFNGRMRNNKPDRCLKVLDFNNRKLYSRCYTFDEMMNIKSLEAKAIKYKTGEEENYLTHFESDDLAWKNYFKKGKYIDYEYYSDTIIGEEIKALVFKDGENNAIVKMLYVKDISPFKNLNYPLIDSTGHNTRVYDISKYSSVDVLPEKVQKLYSSILGASRTLQTGMTTISCTGDESLAALIYSFSVGSQYQNVATYSKILIINYEGTEIFRHEDNDGYVWDARFDSENRYLSYRYAIGNIDTIVKTGYRIWDLKNPGMNFEIPEADAASQFVAPGLLCLFSDAVIRDSVPATTLQIVDLVAGKKYKKTFTNEQLLELVSYASDGLIFNNKTEYFKKDFEGKELSWKKYSEKKK